MWIKNTDARSKARQNHQTITITQFSKLRRTNTRAVFRSNFADDADVDDIASRDDPSLMKMTHQEAILVTIQTANMQFN